MSRPVLSNPSTSTKLPAGAIAGCALAIISVLTALPLLILILRRRRRVKFLQDQELEKISVCDTPHHSIEELPKYHPPTSPSVVHIPQRSASKISIMSTSTYYTTREAIPPSDVPPGSPVLSNNEDGTISPGGANDSPPSPILATLSYPPLAAPKTASLPLVASISSPATREWYSVRTHFFLNPFPKSTSLKG
ncbi:hypothetical protein BKA70DRAFT_1309093 [Coprinopsis sp. MPI-PUGE-AT-0042]|nr:hypothetical protein BKA70DRAFT_1309093 [Coprinopsis sp. MPI-PUGE-AT-0042]